MPGQVTLTIRAEPNDESAGRRLRELLKRMLRSHGWRCISIKPEPPATEAEA